MEKFVNWQDVAEMCEVVFGVYVDWDERFFICPECDEPIYECDWENHDWNMCPICETLWDNIE